MVIEIDLYNTIIASQSINTTTLWLFNIAMENDP